MEQVIIEIVNSHGIKNQYYKFDKPVVTIGRALSNDIIVPDVFVDANHLSIVLDEGRWIVKDNDSQNGVYFKNSKKTEKDYTLTSGEEFKIGKTILRFYLASHSVDKSKVLGLKSGFLGKINNKFSFVLSCVSLIGLYLMWQYASSFVYKPFSRIILGLMGIMILNLLWSGFWAFIGRLIRHKSNFMLHFTITNYFVIFLIFLLHIIKYISFIVGSYSFEVILGLLTMSILGIWILSSHLSAATNIFFKSAIISCLLVIALLNAFVLISYRAYSVEFNAYPSIYTNLQPPYFDVIHGKNVEQLIKDSGDIFK